MNRRTEPRFQVYSPALVIPVDEPDTELACSLIDISATGLRLLADRSFESERMLMVELEDHLVLCEATNSQPRGSRFAIGAERVHTLAKPDLLPQSATERIQLLIDDYHLRLRNALDGNEPAAEMAPQESQPDEFTGIPPNIAPVMPQPPLPALANFASILGTSTQAEPDAIAPGEDVTVISSGLRHSIRNRSILVGIIAGIAVLGTEAIVLRPLRASARVSSPQAMVAATAIAQPPQIPARPVTRRISMTATDNTWITACADGKPVLSKLLVPAEVQEIEFASTAMLRFGNAGGVNVAVNGKPLGPLGERGMVRIIELTSDGWQFSPMQSKGACTTR